MRSVAFSVCLFLNVMLFGMCGYMYLLWLTYWHRLWNQKQEQVDLDMSDFRQGDVIVEYNEAPAIAVTSGYKTKRSEEKKSPLSFLHRDMYSGEIISTRLLMLKTKTVAKLRQTVLDESNNMNMDLINPYGVHPKEYRIDNDNLICDLRDKLESARTLKKFDIDGSSAKDVLPDMELFTDQNYYNSCAVVTSAGSLYHSNLGSFIDSHDLVLRFNNAPVKGYENDVGSKTTIRILNSQILAKSEFHFLTSSLYKNISLLVWDPSNYSSTLQQWWNDPEHNFIEPYVEFRKQNPNSNFHILDPSVLWLLWDFIQGHTTSKIRPNPPSSGFLGIAVLLPYCSTINVIEYVPTQRAVQRCHYYSPKSDPLCTYGVWHPLAAEKLVALRMNVAQDSTVFNDGYISIPLIERR